MAEELKTAEVATNQKNAGGKGKLRKADLWLIAGLLVVALVLCAVMFLTRQDGGTAVVSVDGEEVMTLPLNEDIEVEIGEGEHTNLVVVHDGVVCVKEASCPDKVCVRTGDIQYEGETIVCLPHKLVVSIRDGETKEADAIAK